MLRLAWRVDALDRWRSEVVTEVAELRRDCDELAETDRIAQAVAAAVRDNPPAVTPQRIAAGMTTWQRWGAFAAGALLLADAVKGLLPL